MISKKLGIPAKSLDEAHLPEKASVIYLGWVFGGKTQGLKKALKKFDVKAIGSVCISPGYQDPTIRKKAPSDIHLFILTGGLDIEKLSGISKIFMKFMKKKMLKNLSKIENRNERQEKSYQIVANGKSMVSEENLLPLYEWYEGQK